MYNAQGCVAIGTPLKWEGVYNHYASNPIYLGDSLWHILHQEANFDTIIQKLLQFGRWENFCGDEKEDYDHITSENPDPLFIDWVYIVDSERRMLHVLKSEMLDDEDLSQPRREPVTLSNRVVFYGNCTYKHVLVASVKLDGPEPDWAQIQKGE